MCTPIVKRLSGTGVAAMRDALEVYSRAFDEPQNYLQNQPSDEYLRDLLIKPDFIQLVASYGGQIVGALTAYVLCKFEQARSEIYIYDLAVDAEHRRRGIATALIEALHPIAHEVGAWTIFVQADQGDEPPIALYTKLGEREDVLHFDIAPSHRL
ncbi:MAG: AAC(3)-I family aminoglycoside N-acetyltransferase [Pseudomonadota bacterium]